MPDEQNYLYGREGGTDKLVPQLLLDGNYVSYSPVPYSPDDEGHEGLFKTAPDGLYFYADGLWRKAPAYTSNWDDISGGARFLPVDRDITLTDAERARLQAAVGLTPATPTKLGLVMGNQSLSAATGNVQVDTDGRMYVPPATVSTAGAVLVTDIPQYGAPIVATKDYVDSRVTSTGQYVPVATQSSIGGIKASGDIEQVSVDGDVFIYRAEQEATDTSYTGTNYGLARIAPGALTTDPTVTTYDDAAVAQAGQQPYLVTVSQARAMASHYASTFVIPDRSAYVATDTTIGFAKPGSGLTVTAAGALNVDMAVAYDPTAGTVSKRGTVKVHNGYDEVVGQDLSTVVPTVKSIRDWVEDKSYITAGEIPAATSTDLGGVKINGNGLSINAAGILAVNFPSASTTASGILQLDASVTTATTKAPTSAAVQDYVSAEIASAATPPATQALEGTVKVTTSVGESPATVYTVPTVPWATHELLATTEFANAVTALIPSGGWEGGTVPNPSTFQSTVQFQGLTTVAGGTSGAYAATQVLNYSQIAALIAAGGGGGGGGGGTPGRRIVARDEMSYITVLTRFDVDSGFTTMGQAQVQGGQTTALQVNVTAFPGLTQDYGILTYNQTASAAGAHLTYEGGTIVFGTDKAWAHVVTRMEDVITEDVTELEDFRYVVRVEYDAQVSGQQLQAAVYKVSSGGTVASLYQLQALEQDTNLIDINHSDLSSGDRLILMIIRTDGQPSECSVTDILYRATVQSTGTRQVEVPWASYTPPAFDDPYGTVSIPNDLYVTGDVDCGDLHTVGSITAYGDIRSLNGTVEGPRVSTQTLQAYGGSVAAPGPTLDILAANSLGLWAPSVTVTSTNTGITGAVVVDGTVTVAGSLTACGDTGSYAVIGLGSVPRESGYKLVVNGGMNAGEAQFGASLQGSDHRLRVDTAGILYPSEANPTAGRAVYVLSTQDASGTSQMSLCYGQEFVALQPGVPVWMSISEGYAGMGAQDLQTAIRAAGITGIASSVRVTKLSEYLVIISNEGLAVREATLRAALARVTGIDIARTALIPCGGTLLAR